MAVELDAAAGGGMGMGVAGVWSTCGHGALHLAAANGRTHICRYLVQDLGLPVDFLSGSSETPLVLAATFGHTATAAYLLERGAGPRAADSDGETPLHWAAYNGDRELAMLLLHKGADVGAANPRGTPLHIAAAGAHPEVVVVLLRHGADAGANVNAGGFSGATPLFFTCSRHGIAPLVKCLLDAEADPNASDELGRLPIEIAAVHAEPEVVEVLLPVTQRSPNVPEWSVGGIMTYVDSAEYKEWVLKVACDRKEELKQQGHSAFKKDYDAAILLYSLALKFDGTDAMLYSNRSVCWLSLGVGDEALSDAQACTRIQPDLANGYYWQGMAHRFLQDYASAADDFLTASKLDPQNADINETLRDVFGEGETRCFLEKSEGAECTFREKLSALRRRVLVVACRIRLVGA